MFWRNTEGGNYEGTDRAPRNIRYNSYYRSELNSSFIDTISRFLFEKRTSFGRSQHRFVLPGEQKNCFDERPCFFSMVKPKVKASRFQVSGGTVRNRPSRERYTRHDDIETKPPVLAGTRRGSHDYVTRRFDQKENSTHQVKFLYSWQFRLIRRCACISTVFY